MFAKVEERFRTPRLSVIHTPRTTGSPNPGWSTLPDARVRQGRPDVIFSVVRARSSDRAPLRPLTLFVAVVLMLLVPLVTYGEEVDDVLESAPQGSLSVLSRGTADPEQFSPGEPSVEGTFGFLRDLLDETGSEERFLLPDEAFRLDVEGDGPDRVLAVWQIAPEHYLYRKRFEFELGEEAPKGTSIARVEIPPGVTRDDPYFGPVEIYRSQVRAAIELVHAGPVPSRLDLVVTYQGCADAGLCYPPERKIVQVALVGPGSSTIRSGTPPSTEPRPFDGSVYSSESELSDADRIARTLSTGGLPLALGAFFGFGLLLSFTPCVFPMYPVLSSVLAALGGTRSTVRGFLLSLAYVLASAVAYAIIGGVAGLAGANLQIALQSPFALVATSALFAALALGLFGIYELRVPASWQSRVDGWARGTSAIGGYAGAGAMGLVSALIIGPCVAAPLAGAVIYIGQAGDPLRGGLALFTLGLGMGVPLLVLGASAGKLLPRAGRWMSAVQPVLGLVMLGVAVYLLERVVPSPVALAGWAAVVATSAFLLARRFRSEVAPGVRYVTGAGATVAAIYAIVLVTGAATGAHSPLRPFAGLRSSQDPGIEFIAIKGLAGPTGLENALAQTSASRRFAMLDFVADWCVSCEEFEDTTLRDRRVRAALEDVVALRADVTANDEADRALMRRLGILGPPAILFFAPDRTERRRYRLFGLEDADAFTSRVKGATDAA